MYWLRCSSSSTVLPVPVIRWKPRSTPARIVPRRAGGRGGGGGQPNRRMRLLHAPRHDRRRRDRPEAPLVLEVGRGEGAEDDLERLVEHLSVLAQVHAVAVELVRLIATADAEL